MYRGGNDGVGGGCVERIVEMRIDTAASVDVNKVYLSCLLLIVSYSPTERVGVVL